MGKVLIEAKGNNGQIELHEDKIVLKRKGIVAKLQHFGKGNKEIPIEKISSVEFKQPGYLTAGYIQFGYSGSSEEDGGVFSAAQDENSVNFRRGQEKKFSELKERLNELRNQKGSESNEKSKSALENLKQKFVDGEISEEEFERKKDLISED